MNNTESVRNNIVFRFAHGCMSFIVGLSAFFVIKLLFMVPLNLIAMQVTSLDTQNLLKGFGALLVVVAIFLATRFSRNLNRSGTVSSRNRKRGLTIVFGILSMIFATAFSVIGSLQT